MPLPDLIMSYHFRPVGSASKAGSPAISCGKKPMLSEWSATTRKSSGRDSFTVLAAGGHDLLAFGEAISVARHEPRAGGTGVHGHARVQVRVAEQRPCREITSGIRRVRSRLLGTLAAPSGPSCLRRFPGRLFLRRGREAQSGGGRSRQVELGERLPGHCLSPSIARTNRLVRTVKSAVLTRTRHALDQPEGRERADGVGRRARSPSRRCNTHTTPGPEAGDRRRRRRRAAPPRRRD